METITMAGLHATYDEQTKLVSIIYSGELTCTAVLAAHHWLGQVVQKIETVSIRGIIIDFREVIHFDKYYLPTVRAVSLKIDNQYDFSRIPVALIASNAYQEQMLTIAQRVSAANGRISLLKTPESGMSFIREWNLVNVGACS